MEKKATTCLFKKVIVDGEHMRGSKPMPNEYSTSQNIGFISYINEAKTKEGQLRFKTLRIAMKHGGIPDVHDKYYPDDEKRAKSFSIPVYVETPEQQEFYDFLVKCDQYFDSDEFRKKHMKMGAKSSEYDYSPILRPAPILEDDHPDDDKEVLLKKKKARDNAITYGPKPACIKPHIPINFKTKKVELKVLIKEMVEDEDGNISEEKVVHYPENIDDTKKLISFMSENEYLLSFSKIWQQKAPTGARPLKAKDRPSYGIGLKVICVDCIPGAGGSVEEREDEDLMKSDDEDDEEEIKIKPVKSIKKIVKKSNEPIFEDETCDLPEPPKKTTKKAKAVVVEEPVEEEVDDDEPEDEEEEEVDDDEPVEEEDEEDVEEEPVEEVKPKKISKSKKKVIEPEPEEEEDDEEEEEVVIPKKKKKSKKVVDPEPLPDEDDDEEVVVPKKKKSSKK